MGGRRSGASNEASVTKVESSGHVIYVRGLGDSDNNFASSATSIAVVSVGQVFVGGITNSSNFPGAVPTHPLPPQNIPNSLDYSYGFTTRLSPDLTRLNYSEYVANGVNSIALAQTLPWNKPSVIWTAGLFAPPPSFDTTKPVTTQNHGGIVTQWTDDAQLPAETQFLRLKNFWKPAEYINIQSGPPNTTGIEPGWWSAQWTFELQAPIPGDPPNTPIFLIHNRWMTDEYLNFQNGILQSTSLNPGSFGARWALEQVPGTNAHRIRNVLHPDQYINNQPGFLTVSTIEPGWWSAMWNFERVF
jgi:hypothetical protein